MKKRPSYLLLKKCACVRTHWLCKCPRCAASLCAAGLPGATQGGTYTYLQSHLKCSITSIRGTNSVDEISDVTEMKGLMRLSEFSNNIQKQIALASCCF